MAEQQPAEDGPRIEWETASVSDGRLQVEVAGELPKHWRARFEQVLERLQRASHGEERWGEVRMRKGEIRVADVAEGGEGDLRHLLESVVLEVGAGDDRDAAPESTKSPDQERDERLTSAFRAFGADG